MSRATAGKTNGIADDASRCGIVIAVRTAIRCERVHGTMSSSGVVEGDVQSRAVARRGDGERMQMPFGHDAVQPAGVDELAEQLLERRVVEQRARPGAAPARDHPADRHHRQPARAGADHAERIGAVDLLGAEVLPDVDEPGDGLVEGVGTARQRGGVDRAGRRAGDDGKGVAGGGAAVAPDLRDRLQHADLVGGARAAAGENQPGCACRIRHRRAGSAGGRCAR